MITLVALFLRVWGNSFGLPYEYHVDEVQYVRQAASMGQEGLEPVWWNNPPFFKYILLAEYGGLYVIGRALGWYTSTSDFGARNTIDPTYLYLLGRSTSALFGAATIPIVYWLGKVAGNRKTGVMAAWFLAVAFLHVRDSHYAVNDIAATFFITLVILASVMIVENGKRKWYIVAGLALGFGFATKYSAVFAIIPVLTAHLLSPGVKLRQVKTWRIREIIILFLTALFAAILASPYFIITPLRVIEDAYEALYLAGQQGFEGWQIDSSGGYVFYFKTLIWGLGWGLVLVSMVGIVTTLVRRRRVDFVLLSFPLIYYLIAGKQESYYFARFIIPIISTLLVVGAVGIVWFVERYITHQSRNTAVLIGLTILVTLGPLLNSVRHNQLLSRIDTRTDAKVWIEANLPENSQIAVDWPFYGPPLSTDEKSVANSEKTFDVITIGGHGLGDNDLGWYKEQSVDYLVVSSFISELGLLDPVKDSIRRSFYDRIETEAELVAEFSPGNDYMPDQLIFDELYGPAIDLWQRQTSGPLLRIYKLANQ